MSYILVNPVVHDNKIESNEGQLGGAAEDIWGKLSSNIKQYVPEFLFSIMDTDKKKVYHYKVNEKMENGKVKFVLSQYKNVDKKLLASGDKMEGGRKHKSDDSSSSSSSDSESDSDYVYYPNKKNRRRRRNGLTVTYYPSIYGMPNVLLPTFSTSFAPLGVEMILNSGLPTSITYDGSTIGTFLPGMGYGSKSSY